MCAQLMPAGGKRRGFTMIELMTVIGVIAVLASMLIPVVSRARKSSMRVNCAANLRQITAAALTYAMDHEGQLPNPNWNSSVDVSSVTFYGYGWLYAVADYRGGALWLGLAHPPEDGVMTGVLWAYLHDKKVYHCPMDDPDFRVGTNWLTSYLMNGSQCGFGRLGSIQFDRSQLSVPGLCLPRIAAPTEAVMLWEGLEQRYQNEQLTGAPWNDGSSFPAEEVMADRHAKGANVSCYDGHVEWWDNATWKRWVNEPGVGRLWWNPLTSDGR